MLEYRKACVDEIEELARIRVDFLIEAHDLDNDKKDLLYIENKKFMENSFADESFVSWIALDDGKIVATSGISFFSLPPNNKCASGKVAYISNMFTYPEYRKKGIASRIFSLSVEEAAKAGCEKILLNATDMGRSIYEKFGFKDTKNDMVYYIRQLETI